MSRWSLAIIIGLVLVAPLGADDQPAGVPKDVQQAEKAIAKWLGDLKGKSVKDIRKSLGAPTKETTWPFEDTKQPLLKYKVGENGELRLYTYKERVVEVGFGVDAGP
jgi:hypothetical protein